MVTDGSIGALPHLLKLKLLDSGFVGGNSGTLNTDLAIFDGPSSVHGDLVISLISVFHAQIEVLDVKIEEGVDEFILDKLPEDTGHFVTVQFGNWVLNFDFLSCKAVANASLSEGGYAPRYHQQSIINIP